MKKSLLALLALPLVFTGCIFVAKKDGCCKGGACKDDSSCSKEMKMECCEKMGATMKCCEPKDGKACCAEAGKACACACCKKA